MDKSYSNSGDMYHQRNTKYAHLHTALNLQHQHVLDDNGLPPFTKGFGFYDQE